MFSSLSTLRRRLVGAFGLILIAGAAQGAVVETPVKGWPDCATSAGCSWSMAVDNVEVLSGSFGSNPDGSLFVPAQSTRFDLGDGSFVSVGNLWGNIDPILGFSVSAGTAAVGRTFSFSFSLPIELAGPIDASSSVSYSLTGTSPAGAQIAPLFGNVVVAQEIDTSIGGLAPLNKGVDVGNGFFFVGGPQTQNSPVYTATNSFIGGLAYDLMSVTVAFSLSPNSNVGVSGFVQQLPVPEPGGVLLMLAGLVAVAGATRRRGTAA